MDSRNTKIVAACSRLATDNRGEGKIRRIVSICAYVWMCVDMCGSVCMCARAWESFSSYELS